MGAPHPTLLAVTAVLCLCTVPHASGRPLSALPGSSNDTAFLANWMQHLLPVLQNHSILDLSLPGTHDSMTWDLSTTVADGANDINPDLAYVLHQFWEFVPGKFVRDQAKTQGLNMTQQLENGIRFIDFRIMYSAPPHHSSWSGHQWWCLHFMETNSKALDYLQQARDFLDAHPNEVVVFWLSRHGNEAATGNDQYPDVHDSVKQKFWKAYEKLFQGLLFDTRASSLNTTGLGHLVQTNQRVVTLVSDYERFTGNSSFAIDARNIDNILGDSITTEPSTLPALLNEFRTAGQHRAEDKAKGSFMLMSLAGGPPSGQVVKAAELRFLPFHKEERTKQCAAEFHIPFMTDYCPLHLQDVSQLTNFYNQVALDAVITNDTVAAPMDLPNAIYLDAVDAGGTIRTGTALFGQDGNATDNPGGDDHATTGFAYVDTFLLYMVRRACNQRPSVQACSGLLSLLHARRSAHPLLRWNDPDHGRRSDWPDLS